MPSSAPPTTDIYTLSLHDALPILPGIRGRPRAHRCGERRPVMIEWKGERYYRITEVAALLGRKRSSVYALCRKGTLPVRMVAGIRLVAESDLDAAFGEPVPGPPPAERTPGQRRRASEVAKKRLRAMGVKV